ncbi:MAG: replication-associated recombination protein A [Akkermansia sp.]|nr:replication-associated recombination protein A [Akkermansia sp.]
MDDLFTPHGSSVEQREKPTELMPLAARMRPETLEEVAGQQHLLAPGKLLRRAIETDRFSSLIFYGPPGVGKTTLAYVIARCTSAYFVMLNGVESNKGEILEKIKEARTRQALHGQRTILFVDELHRFNKAQQDVLLPHLERGTVRFIGATTENPYFAINSAMLSRSQIFPLESVPDAEITALLRRAAADVPRGLGKMPLDITDEAFSHLALKADGDARKALTALEVAALSTPPGEDGRIRIDLAVAEESIQKKAIRYDRMGDGHYDTISAFIKSMRGSDPDAALYWLAFMLNAGEDPRFIARRIVICASEDIGLADSNALRVALDAARAVEMVGMPEGRIPLAHATAYLATAPKSNSAYAALNAAMKDVQEGKTLAVPDHLATPTRKKLARLRGVSEEATQYKYAHDYGEEHFVPQAYLPEGRVYYHPTTNGMELRISERMEYLRRLREQGGQGTPPAR